MGMISPLSSSNHNNRMIAGGGLSSTPSSDLGGLGALRLASCSNLLSPTSSTTSGSGSFMSPMPPPSMPLSHSFQTPKRGTASTMMSSSPMEQDSSGFSIPK